MRKPRGSQRPSRRKANFRWRPGASEKTASLVEVLLSTSPVTLNGKRVGAYASYRDITEQKRAEELNAALYAIAAHSQLAGDLQQFFAGIHNIVGQLMNARNFYIALYDPQSSVVELSLLRR